MATGQHTTYAPTGGLREDILDLLVLISPTDTPLFSSIGKGAAEQTSHQWRVEELLAPASNGDLGDFAEGGTPEYTLSSNLTQLLNYTQIFVNSFEVTGTREAVKKVGITSELAHQAKNRMKEHKRDIEYSIFNNAAAGNDGSGNGGKRIMKGIDAFIDSGNKKAKANAVLDEADLVDLIQYAWEDGGEPDVVHCTATLKRRITGFTTNVTRSIEMTQNQERRQINRIDVYESDLGIVRLVANRWVKITAGTPDTCTVYVLDTEQWRFDFLRRTNEYPLAKTGDADKRMILSEGTLVGLAPKANASATAVKNGLS